MRIASVVGIVGILIFLMIWTKLSSDALFLYILLKGRIQHEYPISIYTYHLNPSTEVLRFLTTFLAI